MANNCTRPNTYTTLMRNAPCAFSEDCDQPTLSGNGFMAIFNKKKKK